MEPNKPAAKAHAEFATEATAALGLAGGAVVVLVWVLPAVVAAEVARPEVEVAVPDAPLALTPTRYQL